MIVKENVQISFGVQIAQEALDYLNIKKIALECEELGFDSIWVYDHFYPLSTPFDQPVFESWTTLTALALETKVIRLGTLMTCYLFRYPSVLAKMSATLDIISGGRLEFGIGAGWFEEECLAYGILFPNSATRIKQLKESIQIIKKMWTEKKTDFRGRYYRIKDAICEPKPLQQPFPPIWIGGKGEKLLLKVVAELADYCNFSFCTPEEFKRKINILDKYCVLNRRNKDEIKKSLYCNVLIAETENEIKIRSKNLLGKRFQQKNISNETSLEHPNKFIKRSSITSVLECLILHFISQM